MLNRRQVTILLLVVLVAVVVVIPLSGILNPQSQRIQFTKIGELDIGYAEGLDVEGNRILSSDIIKEDCMKNL